MRARVARAWIDYIVDTRMTPGFKWIPGGASKRKALVAMGEAAGAEADFFTKAEARFALWEMQMRPPERRPADGAARTTSLTRR